MTRRDFLAAAAAVSTRSRAPARLAVPIHRIQDAHAQCPPDVARHFWAKIWPEACVTFGRGGIHLQTDDVTAEMRRTAADRPVIAGLRRGAINMVFTGHIPMFWDRGRALAGVTTVLEGYHVCMVALRYAHGNQLPFLSVNTCVHELLHALLQDVFVKKSGPLETSLREFRVDRYATWLWLFHDGAAIRESAQTYLRRLQLE